MSSTVHAIDASEFPLKSVTVFKSNKAEIIRTFTLELKGGENKVEVSGLSSSVDTKSARVSGLGGAARLLDVVCTIVQSTTPFGLSETIRQYQLKRSTYVAEKSIIEQEAELLLGYGRSLSGEHVSIDKMAEFLTSFRKEKLSSLAATKELDEKIHLLDRKIQEEQEKQTKGKSNGKVTIVLHADEDTTVSLRLTYIVSNAKWEPVYDLHASSKETNSVTLHYRAHVTQTTGEDWKDTELTLSTAAAQANEIPRLGIYKIKAGAPLFKRPTAFSNTQPNNGGLFGSSAPQQAPSSNTVTFGGGFGSTAPPVQGLFGTRSVAQAPQQAPQTLGFGQALPTQPQGNTFISGTGQFGNSTFVQQQQQMQAQMQLSRQQELRDRDRDRERAPAFGAPLPDEGGEDAREELSGDFDVLEIGETPVALTEGTATVRSSPLSASFFVQGLANIPSDGEAHTASIASSLAFESSITRVAVPRLWTQAFLQCRVKNVSEYQLLPGYVSIFLDEGYVSKSSLGDVSPGESFECTLGVDSSVRVSYQRDSEVKYEQSRTFGDSSKDVTVFTSRITVRNKNAFAITRLILRDVLPTVTEDEKAFKVTLREPEGLVDATGNEEVTIKEDLGKWKDSKLKRKVRWGKVINGKGGEKDGKYEWLAPLEAGQEVTLTAIWEVKASRGAVWYQHLENA